MTEIRPVFEIHDLTFEYRVGTRKVEVLKSLEFRVEPGEFIGIQGPSGSGKSTLFYILGFLVRPTCGKVFFDGNDITKLSEDQLTLIRNRRIGFIFQQFHLLPNTSALENILLPTRYPSEAPQSGRVGEAEMERARGLATRLGIQRHLTHLPNQLSGGQQQRVAIARALMKDVDLVLADEPTGNLDSASAREILDVLTELNREGKTIVLITHDPEVAKRCSRLYHLRDGAFTKIETNFEPPASASLKARPPSVAPERLPARYSLMLHHRVAKAVLPLTLENLLRNKTKSLLTMLGVVIGVAAVLAMVTLGQFAKHRILETYEALGVNKLVIRGYTNWQRKATDAVSVSFTAFEWDKDILPLKEIFPEIRYASPSMTLQRERAIAGGVEAGDSKVMILGVLPEYFAITNRTVELGRALTPYQVESRSPVCVIGHELSERLFEHVNPLGQVMTLTDGSSLNFPCRVIGVLASVVTNNDYAPPNLHVLIPYTYFRTVTNSWWTSQIHDVAIQLDSSADVELTGKRIRAYFQRKYGKAGQFYVDSDSTLVAQMKKFLNIFALLLAAIALLSLIVGGIGINNMMLVSVTERLREFGIRKALGATHRSIRTQVLLESVGLCVAAGLIGVFSGFATYEVLIFGAAKFIPNLKFQWIFEPLAVALSFLSIIIVGVASGLVPALRAERLQIVEALRSE